MENDSHIEPHAGLLTQPQEDQLVFKVMSFENFQRSLEGSYLHFNRVDTYGDFHGADTADGEQLPADRASNATSRFEKAPSFSAADYYDRGRSRTYACSFSLEDSDFIWQHYGNGGAAGKIGVTFTFGRLRATINDVFRRSALEFNGQATKQLFYLNYGLVTYVEHGTTRANHSGLPNPIVYSYLKDRARFADEQEMRISLSSLGIGTFAVGGATIVFPRSLSFPFDFKSAIQSGAIVGLSQLDCDPEALSAALAKSGIEANIANPGSLSTK